MFKAMFETSTLLCAKVSPPVCLSRPLEAPWRPDLPQKRGKGLLPQKKEGERAFLPPPPINLVQRVQDNRRPCPNGEGRSAGGQDDLIIICHRSNNVTGIQRGVNKSSRALESRRSADVLRRPS